MGINEDVYGIKLCLECAVDLLKLDLIEYNIQSDEQISLKEVYFQMRITNFVLHVSS